jgi:PTH1 family peptidyl-tRNA hydrolase
MLIAGLGNPGPRYAATRHNAGFLVADELGARTRAAWRAKFQGSFAQVEIGAERGVLLKPETYMNESGQSVRAAADFFKISPASVLVIHDELDLPFGTLRLKQGGGTAGHRGVDSVRAHLGTPDFARLRFGIGRPPPGFGGSPTDFVLEAFPLADREDLRKLVERAADVVALVAERGIAEAMKVTNQRSA